MDFLRFSSSERYVSEVPLSRLAFEVTVGRASIVEEDVREALCTAVVPWDAKEYSPQERLDMYDKVSAALRDFSAHRGDALVAGTGVSPAQEAAAASASAQLGFLSNPSVTALENTISRLMSSAQATPRPSAGAATLADVLSATVGSSPAAAAAGGNRSDPLALPSEQELVERLQEPQSSFFTRPTSEDFIDPAEEDIPVDPPQRYSRLAPLILREHRKEHTPNRHMYLMWATGYVPHRAFTMSDETAAAQAPPGSLSAAGATVPADTPAASAGGLHASESVVGPVRPHDRRTQKLEWIGEERVMCTLTCERDPHYFTAKPSLFEDHTLMVDSTHIYYFNVQPKLAEVAKRTAMTTDAQTVVRAQPKAGSTPPPPPPPRVPALDLDATRRLTYATDEGVRRVHRQQLAQQRDNAQQLLATAVQQVPESGVAATATGLASRHVPRPPVRDPRGTVGEATNPGSFSVGPRASTAAPARTHYHVFGTVERTLHVPYDTLYVCCELHPEPHLELIDGAGAGSAAGLLPHRRISSSGSLGGGPGGAGGGGGALRGGGAGSGDHVFRSQMAHAGRVMYDECLCAVDHVLNLPFQCAYVDLAQAAKPLRMYITVYTEGTGGTGHQAAVAYTNASLPVATPGRHVIEAPLWAPHKTGKEFLKSALVGGAPAFVDVRETGPAVNGTGVGVRLGMVTDNVGLIRIVVNVLHQQRPSLSAA